MYSHQATIKSALTDTYFKDPETNASICFQNITTVERFWSWLDAIFLDCSFQDQGSHVRVNFCTHSFHTLGAIRLRQSRVRADSCDISARQIVRKGSSVRDYQLGDAYAAKYKLFSTSLTLQAYILECDPVKAGSPSAELSAFPESGNPRCGEMFSSTPPWSDLRLGQVKLLRPAHRPHLEHADCGTFMFPIPPIGS
jgi:hypothetical protein